MSGQMKVLIDRLNPMFTKDYKFRDVYFLAAAAEDDKAVPQRAIEGTKGWIECFDKASFKGYVFCGGVTDIGDIKEKESLREASKATHLFFLTYAIMIQRKCISLK